MPSKFASDLALIIEKFYTSKQTHFYLYYTFKYLVH